MARRHMKMDDRTLQCGLPLTPKFARNLAADRLSVTCGACELASRPKIEKPAPAEVAVAAEWAAHEGEEGAPHHHAEGEHHHGAEHQS